MKYIYNRIVTKDAKEILHNGLAYKLQGTNHMGDIDYLNFTRMGAEPLLVVPTFAAQYKEVATAFMKIRNVHTNTAVVIRLRAMFGRKPIVDEFDDGDMKKYVYTIRYKDIETYMTLEGGDFKLFPYFKILSKKVLDNSHNIHMETSPEFEGFFDDMEIN